MPRKRTSKQTNTQESGPLRLQVFLARAGVASRRASEELIREGRVRVNGRPATELGTKVTPGQDRVAVDGRPVELAAPVWIAVHKPKGYVTTRDDPEGRKTVYDLLPQQYHPLFHVGRLDRASEGLLLLTNEGDTANRLLHPRYEVTKEYQADVDGLPAPESLDKLVMGMELEDGTARAEEVQVLREVRPDVFRVRVVLREGRYREVRRLFEAIGHPVQRLVRKRFGPIELDDLRRGRWRQLTRDEVRSLRSVGR